MKIILLYLAVLTLTTGCAARRSKILRTHPNVLLEKTFAAESAGPPEQFLPTQIFHVRSPFTIVIEDPILLRDRIERELGFTNGVAMFNRETRTLYVPYEKAGSDEEFDILGRRMPSKKSLGHELWHLPELGGWWHIQPPAVLQKGKP